MQASFKPGLVSIVTPVYNAERFISQTIKAVQAQTYPNWELILINDCSSDQSQVIIEQIQKADQRVQLINLEQNSGAAVARNTGLEAAKGQYIAFVDSDDVWQPTKLMDQLAYMQENGYAFTYTNFALMDEEGQILKPAVKLPAELNYSGLLKNTAIACSTVVIDRTLVGDFRMPLVRKGQDTATWLKIMRETGIVAHGLDKVLNHYRQVSGSISSNKWGALKRTWHTYRRLEKLPLLKAIYYFGHYVLQAILRRT
ncbi:glycosyltransferase family 2 protein [Vaginisenegalia massiliensis]|uniref:glycosyltransferase family 2 protein n=1 Tax=Vaginisenegalia massiliensis TaxID=2058294 RepID=UPI000F52252A|nr:glycosyltransferase family 2 protein [Vaginisenegalia massiliensis]